MVPLTWEMCVHSGTLVGSPSLPTCMYAARFQVLIGPWSCVSRTQLKSRLFSIVWPWQNASFRLICQPPAKPPPHGQRERTAWPSHHRARCEEERNGVWPREGSRAHPSAGAVVRHVAAEGGAAGGGGEESARLLARHADLMEMVACDAGLQRVLVRRLNGSQRTHLEAAAKDRAQATAGKGAAVGGSRRRRSA